MTSQRHLPASIIGGESLWISSENTLRQSSDIIFAHVSPADGYSLAYQFASRTPLSVEAAANGDDSGWTLTLSGAQTLALDPGIIPYAALLTKDGNTFAAESGTIQVIASPMRVSSWQAVLDSVDAAIAAYAQNPNGSISMGDMSVTFRSMADLVKLRDYANYRLSMDTGRRSRRIIRTRFS